MSEALTIAAIVAVLAFVELVYLRVAKRLGITDVPVSRSSHDKPTVTGGGIIFIFGVWAYSLFFAPAYTGLAIGVTLIGAVSYADDIHCFSYIPRLAVQFVALVPVLNATGCPPLWWSVPLAILCCGLINAFNFMDGINGITALYSLLTLVTLLILNTFTPFINSALLWISTGAVVVFGFCNVRTRALCFAGDVGAITMAYIILFAIIRLVFATNNWAYFSLLMVYGADAGLTIIRRILLGEDLSTAHRRHIYQLLVHRAGLSHLSVALIYTGLQLLITLGLLCLPVDPYLYMGATTVVLTLVYIAAVRRYG